MLFQAILERRWYRQIVFLLLKVLKQILTWYKRLWCDHLVWGLIWWLDGKTEWSVVEPVSDALIILLWQAELLLEVGKAATTS